MGITAKQVNELRQRTGAGMMDCKKALTATDGDMEAAIDFLRKKGQKVSELRSGKDANEGMVVAKTTADGKTGIIVRLSSETDFVAKNEEFIKFADDIASLALSELPDDLEGLLALDLNGRTVGDQVTELVGKINENIKLSAYEKVSGEGVVPYNHMGNRIGVLVSLNQEAKNGVSEIGRDAAMQVAAMNPVAVDENGVPQEVRDREFAVGRDQALAEGKPDQMVDKIAEGRLKKFFKENTLVHQAFVKDGSKTVEKALKEVSADLAVVDFKRIALGS